MRRFLFWLVTHVRLGRLAPWVLGATLDRWPRRVRRHPPQTGATRASLRVRYDADRSRNVFVARCAGAEINRFVDWAEIDAEPDAGDAGEAVESHALLAVSDACRLASADRNTEPMNGRKRRRSDTLYFASGCPLARRPYAESSRTRRGATGLC